MELQFVSEKPKGFWATTLRHFHLQKNKKIFYGGFFGRSNWVIIADCNCTIPLNATLRGQCIPGHGLAFGPLVDLLFPKMNGPLLTSVPKKAYSGNGNLHRCGSLRIWENAREYSWNSRIETFVIYPDKEVAIWLIFIELPKLTYLLLIVSHNMIVKRKIGIRSIAWLSKTKLKLRAHHL